MKSYLKGVWDYFASHMLFMYIGAVIFAWIDIWFFKKIEPSTITATASTITLGLAIYALTKVNEWIRTKKSEKAFERTTLFLDTLFKMKNAVHNAAKLISLIPFEDLSRDDFSIINEYVLADSKSKAKQSDGYLIELQSIIDSFSLWNISLKCGKEINLLLNIVNNIEVNLSVLFIMAEYKDTSKIEQSTWNNSMETIKDHIIKLNTATETIQKFKYDDMFRINK